MSEKSNLDKERSDHAETIIRSHVIWSMGAGFIPVLIADIFAVSALQLDMIRQLCRVYDVNFQETQGKAIVTSLTGSTLARMGAGSIVKLIPGIGSLLGGVTVSIFAGASTYALGEVFKRHFQSGGTILDFDPARLKKIYKEKFEKGKKVVQELRNRKKKKAAEKAEATETAAEKTVEEISEDAPLEPQSQKLDVIGKLRELADLRDSGILTEEEFDAMKKKLLDKFS